MWSLLLTGEASTVSVAVAAPSLRLQKQFYKRGNLAEFGNRYHFHGGTPTDYSHWETFSDLVVAQEKTIYNLLANGGAKIVEAVGYEGGSEVPVFTKTYSVDGTGSFSSGYLQASDVAGIIRWNTGARSTKNHPIYCFNYFHTMTSLGTSTDPDIMYTDQHTALSAYGAAWLAGFSDGTNSYTRARPNGNECTGYTADTLLSHRDLRR